MTALSRGETPGPENSIGKLVNAPKAQDMASFAMDLLDMGGMVDRQGRRPDARGVPGVAAVLAGQPHRRRHRRDPAATSSPSACSGLPQDIRVDREAPFDELPTSKR